MLPLMATLILAFVVAIFYRAHIGGVNAVAIMAARAELFPVLPFSYRAVRVWQTISAHPPRTFSFDQIESILEIAGDFGRWWIAPLLLLLARFTFVKAGWIGWFSRRFDMESLVAHNSRRFHCLRPVVGRGLDDPKTMSQGPWRVAESPMLWAIRHGVVADRTKNAIPESALFVTEGNASGLPLDLPQIPQGGLVIDRDAAKEAMRAQMGPPMAADPLDLPPHMRGLAAAFMAFGMGDVNRAQRLLDRMSRSFVEEPTDVKRMTNGRLIVCGNSGRTIEIDGSCRSFAIDVRGATSLIRKHSAANNVVQVAVRHGSYARVWLVALLEFARRKGGLSSSQFIWLRPADRTLWYLLNAAGGDVCWAECIGPWAHWCSEITFKRYLPMPEVETGCDDWQAEVSQEGWFDGE